MFLGANTMLIAPDARTIKRADGKVEKITLLCRIDTADELEYYRHGGILQYVLRQIAAS
jgi:aconitate hydratase